MQLEPVRNEVTFGVNAIYLNRAKMGFYPTYYVVEDEFVTEDRARRLINYQDRSSSSATMSTTVSTANPMLSR